MLRVGLTGGLGSGKSTVAKLLAARGAHVLESDAIGRVLMLRSNKNVYEAVVARFGPQVVRVDGELDRSELARIAFTEGRIEELNAIVHPAVLAKQEQLIQQIGVRDPSAVVVVESALIFETKHGGKNGWRNRFDCIVLVTAPEKLRIERYIQRMSEGLSERTARRLAYEREANKRMSHQIPDEDKIAMSNYVIRNDGTLSELGDQVEHLWPILKEAAGSSTKP